MKLSLLGCRVLYSFSIISSERFDEIEKGADRLHIISPESTALSAGEPLSCVDRQLSALTLDANK